MNPQIFSQIVIQNCHNKMDELAAMKMELEKQAELIRILTERLDRSQEAYHNDLNRRLSKLEEDKERQDEKAMFRARRDYEDNAGNW